VKIQAAVCDGNTIGHPCCAVHDCKIPLDNHRQRFCSHHQDHRNICAVEGCGLPCSSGSNTCHTTEHQQLEDAYYKPAKALFQLRARLKKAGLSIPPDSMVAEEDGGMSEESIECDGKSSKGNSHCLKARFGTRRTHNEELIMRPCGIILARATFYGSEAVSAVNVCKAQFSFKKMSDYIYLSLRNLQRLCFQLLNPHLNISFLITTASFVHTKKLFRTIIFLKLHFLLMSSISIPNTRKLIFTVNDIVTQLHFQISWTMENGASIPQFVSKQMFG